MYVSKEVHFVNLNRFIFYISAWKSKYEGFSQVGNRALFLGYPFSTSTGRQNIVRIYQYWCGWLTGAAELHLRLFFFVIWTFRMNKSDWSNVFHLLCTLIVLCSPVRKVTLNGHYETPWGSKNVSNILIMTVSTPTRISSWLTWSSF